MPSPAAPTFAYLVALRAELEAEYKGQDEQIREARRIREMERPALEGCDDKYRLVEVDPRDPAVADESFRVQAANSLNRPKLQLEHRESDTGEQNATLRENFTEQCFWTIGTRGQGQDTMREAMDAALNDGGAWTKMLWSKDCWTVRYGIKKPDPTVQFSVDDYNKQVAEASKAAGPPLYWVNVDPLTIYPQWGPDGELSEVLEVQQMPLHKAMRDYRLTVNQDGKLVPDPTNFGMPTSLDQLQGLPSHVMRFEHWDRQWCTYAICGQDYDGNFTGLAGKDLGPRYQFKHGYEFGLPYDFSPGLWMSHWKNRKVGWGIAYMKQWLVAYRAYLRAMHAQYVARDLLSPLFRQVPDTLPAIMGDDGEIVTREEGPAPGFIINGRPGEALQRIEYPDATTLEKHILMVDQAIEKLESPRVTTLEGLEGAGFAISQVLAFDLVRFGPITNSMENLLRRQTEKMWSLIRTKVRETVYVASAAVAGGYLGVGPDDLVAPVGIQWSITPQRATDELVRSRAAHERLQAGTLDEESVIEYLAGNDEAWNRSPDEVRRGKARDLIRKSQKYLEWQQDLVMQYAGRGDLITEAGDALRAAVSGQLPGVTPPAMGNGQVPDLGALATSPNGAGAAPGNGNLGTGPGLVAPMNGIAAGAQPLTP